MTSGASETILRNFFSRSSRATGPKTRVPTGSLTSLMTTAAFWAKRVYVASRRRYSLRECAGAVLLVDVGDDSGGFLVEADIRAVAPAILLTRADDDGLDHLALLDGA